jgi:hypothetical protein
MSGFAANGGREGAARTGPSHSIVLAADPGARLVASKGLAYPSGRSSDWFKSKNPACAAVKREAEEDRGKERSLVPIPWERLRGSAR